MEKEILINADKWFKLHDIKTFINKGSKIWKLYIDIGNFELELSKEEIEYRGELYLELNKKIYG